MLDPKPWWQQMNELQAVSILQAILLLKIRIDKCSSCSAGVNICKLCSESMRVLKNIDDLHKKAESEGVSL